MTDLEKLIAAVEAGEASTMLFEDALTNCERFSADRAELAYFGSLDAALALFNALLPSWEWGRTEGNIYVKHPARGSRSTLWSGPDLHPARAMLLATLRAYAATQEPRP